MGLGKPVRSEEGNEVALVEVENLTKTFKGRPALWELSLSWEAGQIIGLMGDNGAGKTTLLKVLAGVLSDWEGSVRISGHAPGPFTKSRVAFLPDTSYLAASITPRQAVEQTARFFTDFDSDRAVAMIEYFGLPLDAPRKDMSKGMAEKLQIALTMSRDAEVFLLDEPISGVDPAARDIILRGIITQFSPESLMVISTHLLADVETTVDSVVFLRHGQLLLSGGADDLREENQMSLDQLFKKVYAQ